VPPQLGAAFAQCAYRCVQEALPVLLHHSRLHEGISEWSHESPYVPAYSLMGRVQQLSAACSAKLISCYVLLTDFSTERLKLFTDRLCFQLRLSERKNGRCAKTRR
jgi:hypothetical protein